MDLIDIHTHILPWLDGGSPNLKKSLAMAETTVQDGINLMVATPHLRKGTFVNHKGDFPTNTRQMA